MSPIFGPIIEFSFLPFVLPIIIIIIIIMENLLLDQTLLINIVMICIFRISMYISCLFDEYFD